MVVSRLVILLMFTVLIAGCITAGNNQIQNPPVQNVSGGFDYDNYRVPAGDNATPLLFPSPIIRSPMPYYIYNDSEINAYKYNVTLTNLRIAFDAWENATKEKAKFYQAFSKQENGIIVKLVPNLQNDTIGEATSLFYKRNGYTLVVGGEMEIEPIFGGSENRVLLIHEIGHIMGFAHSLNSHSVMYPWNAYSQVITDDILETLDNIYANVPLAV